MKAVPTAPKTQAEAGLIEALETALPAIMMDARRAAASVMMGEHGTKRAGIGDMFWQHREWTSGESLRQIDWRRSARSDRIFVRERERQAPALLQIWCDGRAGMAWASEAGRTTKAQRSLMMGLAVAIAARNGGERVCALGLGSPMSQELAFAGALVQAGLAFPPQFQAGHVLIISDGLENPDVWTQRAKRIASMRAHFLCVLVADPAEAAFPFLGRVSFRSGQSGAPVIVARAQAAQSAYIAAYHDHLVKVEKAIVSTGGEVFRHITSDPATPVVRSIALALGAGAVKRRAA
jgi:hypothetical protein